MATPESSDSLIVNELCCRRGERRLFEHLSFAVSPGSAAVVKGVNGSGKTTLLRTLAGLGLAESGSVVWRGQGIRALRRDGAWAPGWLGHSDGLKAELSARENIGFHRALHERPGLDIDSALARVGLGPVADLPCRVLSAGQRRRAALARLLVAALDPWLLDEPATALDAAGDDLVAEMIDGHCRIGGTVVVAVHRPLRMNAPVIEVTL